MEYTLKPLQYVRIVSLPGESKLIEWFTMAVKHKRSIHGGFYPSYLTEAKVIIAKFDVNPELKSLSDQIKQVRYLDELTFSERCKLMLDLLEERDILFNSLVEKGEMDFVDETSSFTFKGWGPNGEKDYRDFESTGNPVSE